jgi:hypothetical protein
VEKTTGCIKMNHIVEKEIESMLGELKELEKTVQALNVKSIRVNEDLTAQIEILKNQIDNMNAK